MKSQMSEKRQWHGLQTVNCQQSTVNREEVMTVHVLQIIFTPNVTF